jgi:hypothetical protein
MKKLLFTLLVLLFSKAGHSGEPQVIQKTKTPGQGKAATCTPGIASADLDIGNVRARILTSGNLWWDQSTLNYEVPKGSGKNSLYSGSLWFAGIDPSGQIHFSAQTDLQSGGDFWPGPIDTAGGAGNPLISQAFDNVWKINRAEVVDFVQNGTVTPAILSWPGNGTGGFNISPHLAPYYDVLGDGIYDPATGDYPYYDLTGSASDCCGILHGDQSLWWVYNDYCNMATGIEVQGQAFAYSSGNADIDNATFYQYKIINRSSVSYNDFYIGQWIDPDLGNAVDDFVGCDVGRKMGYCYGLVDNGPGGYGIHPPAIGIDLLQGPLADPSDGIDNDMDGTVDEAGEQIAMSKFICFDNINGIPTGNPADFSDFYNYLHGIWLDGIPLTYGEDGRNPVNPPCNYMYPDDTDSALNASNGPWTELIAGNFPGDRRFLMSTGTFTFSPGQVQCITIGIPWAIDTGSARRLRWQHSNKPTMLFSSYMIIALCLPVSVKFHPTRSI